MMNNQNILILKQIRPLIVQLIAALGQLPPVEQSTYNPCVDGTYEEIRACLIDEIEAYGFSRAEIVTIPYLQSNEHLLIFLRALQTVGQQILDCLNACSDGNNTELEDWTEVDAFQSVFPDTIRLFTDPDLQDKAQAGVQNGETAIFFPEAEDFYECQPEQPNVTYPTIEGADCGSGQKAVLVYNNSSNPQGIFRHELGHIFFNMLETKINGDDILIELERQASLDENDDASDNNSDPNEPPFNDRFAWSTYFPNPLQYGDDQPNERRRELFADAFSVSGRFLTDDFNPLNIPSLISPEITPEEALSEANEVVGLFRGAILEWEDPALNEELVHLGRLSDNVTPVWVIGIHFSDDTYDVIIISGLARLRRLYVPTVSNPVPYTLDEDLSPNPLSDQEIIAASQRMAYFQENFCCWVAQLLDLTSVCGCSQ